MVTDSQIAAAEEYFRPIARRAADEVVLAGAPPIEFVRVEALSGTGWGLVFSTAGDACEFEVQVTACTGQGLADSKYSSFFCSASEVDKVGADRNLGRYGVELCRALAVCQDRPLPEALNVPALPDNEPKGDQADITLPGFCDRGCLFCGMNHLRAGGPALALMDSFNHSTPVAHLKDLSIQVLSSMYWKQIEKTLRKLHRENPDAILHFNGNDALASLHFKATLELAYELGFRNMHVQSPGSDLLRPETLDMLDRYSVTQFGLTAHGFSPAVFDYVNGKPGGAEIFWTGLESLLARSKDVFVSVSCVDANVDEIPFLVEKLAAFPVRIEIFVWFPPNGSRASLGAFRRVGCSFERVARALERTKERVDPMRSGVTGMPRCAMTESLVNHFVWSFEPSHHVGPRHFGYVLSCSNCSVRSDCPGVHKVYSRVFDMPAPL